MSECEITYDGVPTYSVSVMEFTDGLVTHETQYFADHFKRPLVARRSLSRFRHASNRSHAWSFRPGAPSGPEDVAEIAIAGGLRVELSDGNAVNVAAGAWPLRFAVGTARRFAGVSLRGSAGRRARR